MKNIIVFGSMLFIALIAGLASPWFYYANQMAWFTDMIIVTCITGITGIVGLWVALACWEYDKRND